MTNTPMVDFAIGTRQSAKRLGAGSLLSLAAAPTFATLALLTANGGAPDILCGHGASSLGSMSLMYGLMALFHLSPWLRLIGKRHESERRAVDRRAT